MFHHPFAPNGGVRGTAEITAFFQGLFVAFPDFHFDIDDVFGTHECGVWRETLHGTLEAALGPFPPTGKSAMAPVTEIFDS